MKDNPLVGIHVIGIILLGYIILLLAFLIQLFQISTILLGFGGLTDSDIQRGASLLCQAWLPQKGVPHES